jgi:hypothetical protein
MKENFDKTKFMIFHKEKYPSVGNVRDSDVVGRKIERVFEFRYLGLLLDPTYVKDCMYDYVKSNL